MGGLASGEPHGAMGLAAQGSRERRRLTHRAISPRMAT